MIVIDRGLCRVLPALARKCVSGRPRGPAPPVVLEAAGGTLTAWVRTADAALAYTAPTAGGDEVLVVPMAVLEAAAGPGGTPVELAVDPELKGEARFTDRGVPTTHAFEALLPGKQHRPPALPESWHPVPAEFLAALHACGRAAARDAGGRFALTRLQVKGRAGQVVGTDGRTALVWRGFTLPFADDVLVPALPVFGARELAGATDVRVGRTAAHLAVAAGPWRVLLPVDAGSRYPDVAAVIPARAPSVAGLDESDATLLLDRLPALPTTTARSPWSWPGASWSGPGTARPARPRRSGWSGRRRRGRTPGSWSIGGCWPARSISGATPCGWPAASRSCSRARTRRSSPWPSTRPWRPASRPVVPTSSPSPPPSTPTPTPRGGPP